MRIIRSVSGMQRSAVRWGREGVRIALVPTMGYLHEGHLRVVRRARRVVGGSGKVVLSIYVNPTQFAPAEDFSKYPRDLRRDLHSCRAAGVDVVFAPADREMYAAEGGKFSTYVVEEILSKGMEGISRPTHFRGVTTVVAKLFNLVRPDVAVFGAKDFQQAAVVRRMVRDLNFPVRLIVAPTHRERDGLAMSSRNKYLQGTHRQQALVLWRALGHVQRRVTERRGAGVKASVLKREVERLIRAERDARLDYVEFFDPVTLEAAKEVNSGTQMALAVFVGKTRLIDNARLR